MRVTFSILIPTSGRYGLLGTLQSIIAQLQPGDEVIVDHNDDGDWGNAARNRMIPRAKGTHLLFIDDDDVYVPEALSIVRHYVGESPWFPHSFVMQMQDGSFIPPDWPPLFECGHIGTPIFCVPNIPEKLARWGDRYEGDWDFIEETVRLHDLYAPICHDTVIAQIGVGK